MANGSDDDDRGGSLDRRALLELLAGGALLLALPAAADTALPAAAPDALSALVSDGIFGDRAPRRVLYTWTTPEQIAELRGGGRLLSRSESPRFGPSYYDRWLTQQAASGEPWAQLLRKPEYRKARFAWTNAWATLLGWGKETYGDQLVRIVLREDAWLAVHDTRSATWRFLDMSSRAVRPEVVARTPRRLGGVYFVQDRKRMDSTMGTFIGGGGAPYREVVLCNEAMVASFEVGTPAPRAELTRSIAALSTLRRELAAHPPSVASLPAWSGALARRWSAGPPPRQAIEAYEAALAFPNDLYLPGDAQLAGLITSLEHALAAQPAPLRRP